MSWLPRYRDDVDDEDLLLCPFCASTALSGVSGDSTGDYLIGCDGCAADGPPYPAVQDAIDAWNRRA